MIVFDHVSKKYKNSSLALDDVTFRIKKGEFVSVVGQSGYGKSTLLKLVIGEEKPTKGSVIVGGYDVTALSEHELHLLRRKVGMIFQDFRLLPKKTVYENVAFSLEVSGASNKEIEEDVPQVLELVGLSHKSDKFPSELSGGEKQRVAIARALVDRPDILIADEPTGSLDSLNTWDVIRLLIKINELGATVVLATHNREVINMLNKRVITLDNGRIIRDEENGRYIL
ncbi:cell division ATP-binding protein FtsE [Candidatus Azambacteria bacterium]|nr:cell division ATP-binding protein FtsE [Candidatus Azambacteria bacterium]